MNRTVLIADHSISSLTGSSQSLVAQDMTRSFIMIENVGNNLVGVNPTGGTATIGSAGTFTINPSGSLTFSIDSIPGNAMTVTGTSGQPVSCVTNP